MSVPLGPILFLVGPTAVGKTRLAVALAEKFGGEIINADSRQVYRHMDVGTSKPTLREQARARHHLLDLLDPDETFSLGRFLSLARSILGEIRDRGRVPFVVGGTGQYIWALREGWQVPEIQPDPEFRRAKQQEVELHGSIALFRQLEELDPERAKKLDPSNVRRVIRALEIHHVKGVQASVLEGRSLPLPKALMIGLTQERKSLYRSIDLRVDRMMADGFLEEVQGLAANEYMMGAGPLSSPGYRELGLHLADELDLDEAVQRTKFQTHRLARRQYTWFKPTDPRIQWLDTTLPDLEAKAESIVMDFLSANLPVIQ